MNQPSESESVLWAFGANECEREHRCINYHFKWIWKLKCYTCQRNELFTNKSKSECIKSQISSEGKADILTLFKGKGKVCQPFANDVEVSAAVLTQSPISSES